VTQGIAKNFGTDAILLFMAAQVAACVPLVMLIWRQQAREDGEPDAEREDSRNLRESWRLMMASPHLRAIAILILIGSVVTTIAGWQYKSLAKEAFARKDELTAFFGAVTGWTGIAALTLQLILTGKLLRRFGVGITLLVLPVFLMAGSVLRADLGLCVAGTFLRASDVVIRYSVDTSAIQLLYLPVAAHIKLQVKSFIDTVIWKVGDGIAGLTLLLFATKLQLTPREIGTVSLIMIGAWLVAAMVARREYVVTLRENIQGTRLAPDAVVPTLDHTAVNLLAEKLSSPHATDVPLRSDAVRDRSARAVARRRSKTARTPVGRSAREGCGHSGRGRRSIGATAGADAAEGRRPRGADGGAAVPDSPRRIRFR
jgi:AAA family ATP:ADP antiporter